MNKKDLKAVLLASALCGAAAVVPVMADEVEQDPVDVQDQVLETSNDGNAITNDSEVVENTVSIPLSEVHAICYRSPHNPLKKSIFFKS